MKDGKFWINIDFIFAIISIILGVFAFILANYLSNAMLLLVALILLTSALIYLLCRNKFQKTTNFEQKELYSRKENYCLFILFYILFSINLLLFFFEEYSRPIIFIIITSIMAGIIAVSIYRSFSNFHFFFILLQIISLSCLIQGTAYFQFPSMIGNDPNAHADYIFSLSRSGDISKSMAPYQSFPLMHLLVTLIHILTNLPIKLSMGTVMFCMIVSLTFLYLIGKTFFREKISLIGLLFLSLSAPNILLGYIIIPQSLGITFIPMLVFLLFTRNYCLEKNKSHYYFFTILLLIALLFTHSITSFVTLIILISILIVQTITYYINQEKNNYKKEFLFLIITVIFFILLIEYWSISFGFSRFALDSIRLGFSSPDLAPASSVISEMKSSIIFSFMKFAPTFITIFFAIIGSLFILKCERKKFILLFGWGVVIFSFFCVFLDLHSFLPGRWLAFIPLVLFFPLALSLNIILNYFTKNQIINFILITIIAFTMLTNYEANVVNLNPFTPYPTQALSKTEMISANTLTNIVTTTDYLFTDVYFRNAIGSTRKTSDGSSIYLYNEEFSGILVVRDEILKNVFFAKIDDTSSHYSSVLINSKKIDRIMNNCKIYDCGKVQAVSS